MVHFILTNIYDIYHNFLFVVPMLVLRILKPAALGFFLLLFVYGMVFGCLDGFSAVFYVDTLHISPGWYGKLAQFLKVTRVVTVTSLKA